MNGCRTNHGGRTEWTPLKSVIIIISDKQNQTTAKWDSCLSITSMITDRTGQ